MSRRSFGIFRDLISKFNNRYSNKEEVGQDMYGNSYYQIYDAENFPFKREVVYKHGYRSPQMDPIWINWLKGEDVKPPTSNEVKSSFDNYIKRKEIAEEYDKKDEEAMAKFRLAMKKTARPILKKEFEPQGWNPTNNGGKKY
jgi:NADH:ubiquinone oxidoreductase subunit